MKKNVESSPIISWLFSIIVVAIGILNMLLVHPVPGAVFLLLSLVYIPPANNFFKERTGFSIPTVLKLILGILIIWFTLGPSDLGDIIDSLSR